MLLLVWIFRDPLTLFATEWLEDVGPFDVALVLLGVNDAAKGLASEFKTHFGSIVSTLSGLSFKPELILGKPLPLLSREFVASSQMISNSVEDVGREQGAHFFCFHLVAYPFSLRSGASVVDLATGKYANSLASMVGDDGVHPNWAGDAAIAESWLTALQRWRASRKTEM
jgi:lysophospholipase L1-like esterase